MEAWNSVFGFRDASYNHAIIELFCPAKDQYNGCGREMCLAGLNE